MKLDQQQIEELLFGYFSGNLTETEEKKLLTWLEADESHKKTFSEMSDWWATIHVPLFASDLREDFTDFFATQKKEKSETSERKWGQIWKNVGKVAAVLLLLITIGTYFYYLGKKDEQNNRQSLLFYSSIETPAGSRSKNILPDGTVVWLNSDSHLSYSLEKSVRRISLTGEAYFEVAPDSLRPFIVKSRSLDVKVLGTSFNIKAYENEDHIDVTLLSGKVNVSLNSFSEETEEIVLTPNRMLSFDESTKSVNVTEISGNDVIAWTGGYLKFREQLFPCIARDLERRYNVQIVIESNLLKKESFSGSFLPESTLDQVLREIDVDKKFTWSQTMDVITVKDK